MRDEPEVHGPARADAARRIAPRGAARRRRQPRAAGRSGSRGRGITRSSPKVRRSSGIAFGAISPGPTRSRRRSTRSTATRRPPPATDWRQILQLYDQLLRFAPGPVVALNRAVAVAEVEGPSSAAAVDTRRCGCDQLDRYHLFHAIRADFLRRLGRTAEAAAAYEAAIALQPERDRARLPAARVRSHDANVTGRGGTDPRGWRRRKTSCLAANRAVGGIDLTAQPGATPPCLDGRTKCTSGGRSGNAQTDRVYHGVTRELRLPWLQRPRRMVDLQPVRPALAIDVVQAVTLGQKVFEGMPRPAPTPILTPEDFALNAAVDASPLRRLSYETTSRFDETCIDAW